MTRRRTPTTSAARQRDRQQFSGTPQRAAVDLFGQLLNPVIGLSIADAVAPLQAFFQGASGVTAPSAPSLPALVALLLRPAPEREQFVGEVPQPELLPSQDAGPYTEEHWRLADELLDLSGTTRDLSDLLADARRVDPDLPRLVALRAVHAYTSAFHDLAVKCRVWTVKSAFDLGESGLRRPDETHVERHFSRERLHRMVQGFDGHR